MMRIGIAADHAGFELKNRLAMALESAGCVIVDFGARGLVPEDDYPDFVIPMACAVARGELTRGLAICGSGVGACIAANKVPGARAALITDSFSAHQGVEDDDVNVMCLGALVIGPGFAWDLVKVFLGAQFSGADRFRRRLAKVAALECRPNTLRLRNKSNKSQGNPNSIAENLDVICPPYKDVQKMAQNPLKQIESFGQSIWLDYIRRDLMAGDGLRKLIHEDGIRGMTSNPAIFEKAITDGAEYDQEIYDLAKGGKSAEEVYDALSLKDVQDASDQFRTLFDTTAGKDGLVSLEVSPHIAHDAKKSIEEARRLWTALDRPNVFIKIPATDEGLVAIRQVISDGINVNVTLIFGLTRYRQVAEAFIAGLEDRVARKMPIEHVASVASYFVSRIDAMVDPLLENFTNGNKGSGIESELLGQVAISSAKITYHIHKEIFASERFQKLSAQGAQVQRLLWASTGTKNPDYSDVKYIEALIGPNTVNTAPPETIDAYRDHGTPQSRLELDVDQAIQVLERLEATGIHLEDIARKLEIEGAEKFVKPFDKLLSVIAARSLTSKS